MKISKKKISFSIATALIVSTLSMSSISVYAKDMPKSLKNISSSTSLSAVNTVNLPTGLTQYVYDSVHQKYVGIGNGYALNKYGQEDTSMYVGYIYTSIDGVNWTKTSTPDAYNVYGIATDGKGNIVIGTNYGNSYSDLTYLTNRIRTSNDGGSTWALDSSGDGSRLENDSTPDGTPAIVYNGVYIGKIQSASYSNGKFMVVGSNGNLYSLDGYSWNR